ncbi:MAG: hypothetical protein CMK09_03710 [Ponticaulis sp.]|nr:hypothetical protein [Ponticaulis sp.]|tara:strand:+ start:727 stop:1806 length:1080 start_codon:yes stop_codon:yes gene_type:complete
MHWIAFIAAALALFLAHILRAPDRSRRVVAMAWFLSAFLVSTFTIRVISERVGITRPTEFDQFVSHAALQASREPDAPLVLFVGASFTRNAIDDQELTRKLRDAGYPHRVINLSLQGASLQERDAHLWAFMRSTQRAPDVVFLEVADEFDRDPAYVFNVAKFSDRAIEQFDPDSVFWSLKGLAQGQCDGLKACLTSAVLLKAHALMNWSNLGLFATGKARKDISPVPAFDPQDHPRETFRLNDSEIQKNLSRPTDIAPYMGPAWARLFRIDQRRKLEAAGVRRVAYYYPPVIPAEDRQYVARLCAGELSDFPCIAPVDQKLLQALEGQVWLDEKHLLRNGADVYTAWLADQIERWGALN